MAIPSASSNHCLRGDDLLLLVRLFPGDDLLLLVRLLFAVLTVTGYHLVLSSPLLPLSTFSNTSLNCACRPYPHCAACPYPHYPHPATFQFELDDAFELVLFVC